MDPVLVWNDEKVQEMDGEDGGMSVYLTSQNYALQNVSVAAGKMIQQVGAHNACRRCKFDLYYSNNVWV